MEIESPNLSPNNADRLYKWKVLITIMLGTVMGAMDFSMVNLAFPKLTQVFNTRIDVVVWVTLAFTLSNTSLLLIVGKIGDLVGRKQLYIAGEIIFNCGILACAFSQSIGQLIGFRIFLGIGASMIFSSGPALLASAFPPKDLGKGMGTLNAGISAGFIIGPVVGGLLLNWIDWRSIFYTRLPFGVLTTVMSIVLLKPDQIKPQKISFDVIGMLLSVSGLFLLVFGVNQVSRMGLTNLWVNLQIGGGCLLLAIFVWVERRVSDPILDFSLFKNRLFTFFSLSLFIFFVAVPIFVLILPFFFMEALGLNPSQAGLLLAVSSIVSIAVGPVSGMLSDRYGEVWLAALGGGIIIVGYNFIRILDTGTSVIMLVPIIALIGAGAGMYQTPNNSAIIRSVPKHRLGTAAALIATLRGVGMAFGMALIGTIYAGRKAAYLTTLEGRFPSMTDISARSVFFSAQDTIFAAIFFFGGALLLTLAPLFFRRK